MTDTHIKMPDVAPLVRYLADGAQTVFDYPFPIFASEDIGRADPTSLLVAVAATAIARIARR